MNHETDGNNNPSIVKTSDSPLVLPAKFKPVPLDRASFWERSREISGQILGYVSDNEYIREEFSPFVGHDETDEAKARAQYESSDHYKLCYALGLIRDVRAVQRPKRIRPMLVDLILESAGVSSEAVIPVKVGVEMIHSASLIHDDIRDRARTRYGIPAFHRKYGQADAIDFGTSMAAAAQMVITRAIGGESSNYTAQAIKDMSTGQRLEGRVKQLPLEERFSRGKWDEIVRLKTRSMHDLCSKLALYLFSNQFESPEELLQAYNFFEDFTSKFATWFQGLDDLKDYKQDRRYGNPNLVSSIKHERKITYQEALMITIEELAKLEQEMENMNFISVKGLPLNVGVVLRRMKKREEDKITSIPPSRPLSRVTRKASVAHVVSEKV